MRNRVIRGQSNCMEDGLILTSKFHKAECRTPITHYSSLLTDLDEDPLLADHPQEPPLPFPEPLDPECLQYSAEVRRSLGVVSKASEGHRQ